MIRVDRLKALRQSRGLTPYQLGEALKTNVGQIHQLESGRVEPSCFRLIALAYFFGVSTDYLLGLTDNPTHYHSGNFREFLIFSGGGLSSTAWREHLKNQALKMSGRAASKPTDS
ncbi:MAG: helix-turn-helix domain-containing protein [Anaerolineae bacterium]|nr:helix-turn-helix domain-containing protein [Anaerolineae bacterium]